MNNAIFQVNWHRLVQQLTPSFLRKSVLLAWLYVLTKPIRSQHEWFLQRLEGQRYRLSHNGQVCYLQKVLNDAFDNAQRRIVIETMQPHIQLYVYHPQDEKPLYIYDDIPVYLYDDEEDFSPNFIIKVPTELQGQEEAVKRLTNYYKIYSKNYKIIYI